MRRLSTRAMSVVWWFCLAGIVAAVLWLVLRRKPIDAARDRDPAARCVGDNGRDDVRLCVVHNRWMVCDADDCTLAPTGTRGTP